MLDSLGNYRGVWDIEIDGERMTRFECPYIDLRSCRHPKNQDTDSLFMDENCVYTDCPVHIRTSFRYLNNGYMR